MNTRRKIGIGLLILGVLALPVGILLNKSVGKMLSQDYTQAYIKDQVFTTRNLSVKLRSVVNERIKDVTDLKTGMIIAIFSKADSRKWEEIINMFLPVYIREPILDNLISGIFDWMNNTKAYPEVKLDVEPAISNLEENTEFLFRWAHSLMHAPVLPESELIALQKRDFGDSIPSLLMSNVPGSMYDAFARRGAELMALELKKANPPLSIDLGTIIHSNISAEKIILAKSNLNRVRFLSDWLWVIALMLLAGGLWLYSPKFGDNQTIFLIINSLGGITLLLLSIGWLVSNYLFSNLELLLNERAAVAPRAVRDQLLQIIAHYVNNASSFMYTVGFSLFGIIIVVYLLKNLKINTLLALQLKSKKS